MSAKPVPATSITPPRCQWMELSFRRRWHVVALLLLAAGLLSVSALAVQARGPVELRDPDERLAPRTALGTVLAYTEGHRRARHDPAFLAADAVMEVPGLPPVRGPEAIVGFLDTFYDAIDERRIEVETGFQSEAGDRVAVVGRVTGARPGPSLGGPPSGNRIDLRLGVIYEMRDGKIARIQLFFDPRDLMR